jgi:hypothetical protein
VNKLDDLVNGVFGITIIEVTQFIPTLNLFEDILIHSLQITIGIITIKNLLNNKKNEK